MKQSESRLKPAVIPKKTCTKSCNLEMGHIDVFNSFLINVPILYPKNFKRPRVFWCFQGKKIGNIGQKWFTIASYHKLYGKTTYPLLTYYVLQNNIMRFCQSKNRTFISISSQKNKITAN